MANRMAHSMPWSALHPGLVNEIVEPQRLFEMLDGRDLFVSKHHWLVEVFGVSDQSEHRWVQLRVKGIEQYMLTIRLETGAGPGPAIAALSSWLSDPSEAASQILN